MSYFSDVAEEEEEEVTSQANQGKICRDAQRKGFPSASYSREDFSQEAGVVWRHQHQEGNGDHVGGSSSGAQVRPIQL